MNTVKIYPSVGDIAILVDGKIRFVGQDATSDFIEKQQAIGVVYFTQGSHVKVVAGKNDVSQKWSCVADYEIESIPESTGEYAVTVYNNAVGNFSYTRTAGTKEEFVTQLNAWLETNAADCEAYMQGSVAVFQISDYTKHESNVSIAGCRLRKRIGEELESMTVNSALNQVHQTVTYPGLCHARLIDWAGPSKDANCNPTERMDGVTKLCRVYPCSEAYYNGDLGDGLRAHYPTYHDYLWACMARPWELDRGIMTYRDGKAACDLLKGKKVLVRGEEKAAYPAVEWAVNYDSGVPGFGKGSWWLPSMHELALLMTHITSGTKQPADAITSSLQKKEGWSAVSAASVRWSCCRFSAHHAWHYVNIGTASYSNFYYSFGVSAVSAFNLDFNS